MTFYIASGLDNRDQVRRLARLLTEAGWVQTYDWTACDTAEETTVEALQRVAMCEADAVRQADIIIVLSPKGRGTHVELGMAIALGKHVYICDEVDDCLRCDQNTVAFYWLPQVTRFIGSTEEIAAMLLSSYPAL